MPDDNNSGGNDHQPDGDSNDKFEDQIELILAEFGDEIEIDPPNWRTAGVNAIYRSRGVLVRDHDAPRTVDLFGGGNARRSSLGVTRLDLPDAVPAAAPHGDGFTPIQRLLAHADRQFGRGHVTPEHLFYVCSVSPCPATEPEEVLEGALPDPFLTQVGKADGHGVKVVVLDVGWTPAPNAPWLHGVSGDPEVAFDPVTKLIRPYAGHGTFIAGVVRAIAPQAEVVVKSYFDKAGAVFEADLADRLAEVMEEEDPDIISLSAGSTTRFDVPSMAFDTFTRPRQGNADGPVLVAAAGNDGTDQRFWPAAYPEAVSVGALAADGTSRASFSNYGSWVDVYAPGENLVNAFLTGRYKCTERPNTGQFRDFAGMAKWSGTSFATPLVAGLIAARMSLTGERPKQAANALLAISHHRVLPAVGPVLLPTDAQASTHR